MWRDNNDTRRFIKSIDTEVSHESSHKSSVLPCVSHSREGERERYPDTENQSTVVRTGQGPGPPSWHGDQGPTLALTPRPERVAPRPRLCNALILSVIKIFYIPDEIIIADCSPCWPVIQRGPGLVFIVQCQKDIFTEGLSHNNSSNHLFSVPRPGSWRRVMCCDAAWRDKMHLSRLSPGLVSSLGR